ncbi:unnamed protein product [Trichobilharzia regenti]|nr:unnamed protein product [Trichobilharzia regenti]
MNSANSPSHHQNNNGNTTTTTNSNNNSSANSPDTNNYSPQNKDIFEIIKKMSPSPQSDIRANDNDCIIPRDQIKVSFVLRSMEKSLNEENNHTGNQTVKSEDPMKPVEYTKQERGRSKSRAHGRRVGAGTGGGGDSRNNTNSIMTKSSIFFDNSTSASKQAALPLRAAISTSSLQSGITQDNLFAIVYYNGVDIEGIFRRTAVHSQIELMRARVDENIQTITPNNCNPILASCVLKRFFCEIPGHLLIDAKWDEWASLTEINSPSERLQLIEKLVRSLPKVNQTLLALLIYLLAHIRDNEEMNRMSARNLAVVWGPNLIQRPNTPLALDDSKIATQIVTYLLEPPVTNFLLETSNAKNELNQHFKNIWGNLKGTSTTTTTSKTMESSSSSKLQNMSTSMTIATATTTITDSSEEEKSSRLDSGVHSEQKTEDSRQTPVKGDVRIKYPSRRGHSVSKSDSVFINEKHYSSLLKTNEPHDDTPVNAPPTVSSTGNSSHSSTVISRRGVGRMNRKKHSLLSHMTLPDQTGPPTALKQTVGNPDTTTNTQMESKNLTRLRATSTIVQPLSSSLALTPTKIMLATASASATTTTSEMIGTPRHTSDVRRSRNTSCPPNRKSALVKLSTPYPLPKTQVELEAPPIPPRLQPTCTGQNNPSVKCNKHTSIVATNTPSIHFNHSQQTKVNPSQGEEKTPSPPIPKRTIHRRTRPQKTTSEIPDITLLNNAYYAKDSRSMNNGGNNNNGNTYRRRNSIDSQGDTSRAYHEAMENDESTNSTSCYKTNEYGTPIKIISVSAPGSNNSNNNNRENTSEKSYRYSNVKNTDDDNLGSNNNSSMKSTTKLLQPSTDHRTRNNMPRSESDMSVISSDSSSFSSPSMSSFRKHSNNRQDVDLTANANSSPTNTNIPSPVVHRPEFNTQDLIINPQQCKSGRIIHRMISLQHPLKSIKKLSIPSDKCTVNNPLPSSFSSSLSSSSSPTSFSSSDIGYATTSHHENQDIVEEIDRIEYGKPVSRMSSHASTISSGSATVISTSTEK